MTTLEWINDAHEVEEITIPSRSSYYRDNAYELKKCIMYRGKTYDDSLIDNIKKIIWRTDTYDPDVQWSDHACPHCGCGDDIWILCEFNIEEMKEENKEERYTPTVLYGLIRHWSGCLTYTMDEVDATLWYGDDLDDIINYCMDEDIRRKYNNLGYNITSIDSENYIAK